MAWRVTKTPMTNKQDKCECGSGFMPTLMELSRNRWACQVCFHQTTRPRVVMGSDGRAVVREGR